MKKLVTFSFILVLLSSISFGQVKKNPVLEYCTGTWCQWCPCGKTVIKEEILPAVRNAIILAYHGPANTTSEPMSTFPGNTIISSLGLSSYPTGIINRSNSPASRSAWAGAMVSHANINATVDILALKEFNETTRLLKTHVTVTPLQNLSGTFKYSIVLTEDSLIYSQTGNSDCPGNSVFQHDYVVRSMVNGALGEELINGTWNLGTPITKTFEYTVPSNIKVNKARLVVFVYQTLGAALNRSEIQQAMQYDLLGNNLPVELAAFTAAVEPDGIRLNWTTCTEINNYGFEIQKSLDGINFNTIGFIKGTGSTTEIVNYTFKENYSSSKPENFFYRLRQIDYDGNSEFSDMIEVGFDIPTGYSLGQNYPNPFNPSTIINYRIPELTNVEINVVDILGNKVASLVNEVKAPGSYEVSFEALNIPSGVYFYQIKTNNYNETKKMMLMK